MTVQLSSATIVYVGLTLFTISTLFYWFKARSDVRFPPGPQRRFLIGNFLDMPKKEEWLIFDRWDKEYGDLVYVSMLGTSILIVNSYETAQELFDKRGNIYSDRYQSTVVNEMLRFDWMFASQPHGDRWRRHRACFTQFFNQTAIQDYRDVQQRNIQTLLRRLYQSPDNFRSHIRFVAGSLILEVYFKLPFVGSVSNNLQVAYGISPYSENDPLLVLSESTITKVTEVGIPGTYLVDMLPISGIKALLDGLRKQIVQMVDSPIETVRAAMRNGDAVSSVTSLLIEQSANDQDRPSDYADLIKHIPATAYVAGADTIDCVALHFFLAMATYPYVQKKAQAELDSVVGQDVLPSFHDRKNLPYIEAIFKEVLRWNTAVNISLLHVLSTDDTIGEYFVPKGTIVFGNSWTLLRSMSVYSEDADKFRPERFMDGGVPDPDYAFGYGRRICPGQYFADSTMFLPIASVLHVYDILPVEGKDGPEYPRENFDSGVVLRPKPFKCRIIPRSSAALKLVEELNISEGGLGR